MKKLILMRHAAYTHKGGNSDYHCVLSKHGKEEAVFVTNYLKEINFIPDFILTSSATRARQTADIIAKAALSENGVLHAERKLYLADYETINNCLQEVPSAFENVLLVGHNPGISILARIFSNNDSVSFPTAGLAVFKFSGQTWHNICSNSLELTLLSVK